MAKRITIQDIADELGLSRNTVSKALNNSEGLADATRQRIIQKAAEMGYKQFALINLMPAQQRENAFIPNYLRENPERREVALFSTTYLAAPHFSSLMLDAFQNNLALLGLTLNTHRVTPANLESHTLPITFDINRVAAIICIEMFDRSYDQMVCALGVPTLFVDAPPDLNGETLPCDQLIMENTSQVVKLVSEMLSRHHSQIGFIGNWEHCQSFYERYCAFRLAMTLNDAPVNENWLIPGNNMEEIHPPLSRLARENNFPELFICANDFIALDVMRSLYALGLNVPNDIALAGFDDSSGSRRCIPPLTTVHIHTQIMAYEAVRLLRSRMEEPSLNFRRVYTETELIWRASTSTLR